MRLRISTARGIQQAHINKDIGFKMPKGNLLILNRNIVVAALVPNAGKALAAQGLRPDIAVVHSLKDLNELFFPCAIASAQSNTPVTVIVPNQKMKEAVEQYMLMSYRPKTTSELSPHLRAEAEYFDASCERELDKIIKVVIVEYGREAKVHKIEVKQLENGRYSFNGKEIDCNNLKPIRFNKNAVPLLDQWDPDLGIFMLGVNSAGYAKGLSAAFLVRTKRGDLVVDCGPQIPEILKAAKVDPNKAKYIVTHTHPDHDSGIFDLLSDPQIGRINLFTHLYAAEIIFEKARMMGLEQEAMAKVPFLRGGLDLPAFQHSVNNLTPIPGELDINGLLVKTEWAPHGIPTIMLKLSGRSGQQIIYTSDGTFSDNRLAELRSAYVLSSTREARIRRFFNVRGSKTTIIEEVGMGRNHSTQPMKLAAEPEFRRLVHWATTKHLPVENLAQTFEVINLA